MPPPPIETRSFYISPCTVQLSTVTEIANKYRQLYLNQVLISQSLARTDSLSQWQATQADSLYRNQVAVSQILLERAEVAEAKVVPLTKAVGRLGGRTKAGKLLRRARDRVLAPVGAATIAVAFIKLIKFL